MIGLRGVELEAQPANRHRYEVRMPALGPTATMRPPAEACQKCAVAALPGCLIAAVFISAWHYFGAFRFLSDTHETVARSGQVFSYAAHAFLMFSVGLSCRLQLSRHPGGLRSSGYLCWLGRIVAMYWISLLMFWLLGIVSGSRALLGVVCGNVVAAEDLLTLWFVQIIILFLFVGPAIASGGLIRRLLCLFFVFGVLGMIKLAFKWVDIRIFELLPVFVFGASLINFGPLRAMLNSDLLLIAVILIVPVCGWCYSEWYESAAITSVSRSIAMWAGVVILWRISTAVSNKNVRSFMKMAGASWLGVILLHRIVQWLSGVSRLDLGGIGSCFMLGALMIPATIVFSMGFCRLFMMDRAMGLGTSAKSSKS